MKIAVITMHAIKNYGSASYNTQMEESVLELFKEKWLFPKKCG